MSTETVTSCCRTDFNGLWADPILEVRCFDTVFHIAEFPAERELNIQMVITKCPGQGNAQAALTAIIAYFADQPEYADWQVVSSTPINPAWAHICGKFGLKVYEEPTEEDILSALADQRSV